MGGGATWIENDTRLFHKTAASTRGEPPMPTLFDIFNANRTWILPVLVAFLVVCLIVYGVVPLITGRDRRPRHPEPLYRGLAKITRKP